MEIAGYNNNSKIWYFVAMDVGVEVVLDTDQQITLRLFIQESSKYYYVSLGYAKCTERERLGLWDIIYQLANTMSLPWLVGGDFNVILNEEE